MKDKLLFGTIGLLVGIVVMQWTMPASQASYVSTDTGIISAMDYIGDVARLKVLDQNGKIWYFEDIYGSSAPTCWSPSNYPADPPMPVASIKFWSERWVVTTDNHVWMFGASNSSQFSWQDCGPWPGSPVAAEQSTWGKVKAAFNKKGDKP